MPSREVALLPENPVVRNQLRAWQMRTGWNWAQISSAIRLHTPNASVAGVERLGRFARGEETLGRVQRLPLFQLLSAFPLMDRTFDEFAADMAERNAARIEQERRRAVGAPEQRERERTSYSRYWMSREQPANGQPARRERPVNHPLFGLDKATVSALSGGTL